MPTNNWQMQQWNPQGAGQQWTQPWGAPNPGDINIYPLTAPQLTFGSGGDGQQQRPNPQANWSFSWSNQPSTMYAGGGSPFAGGGQTGMVGGWQTGVPPGWPGLHQTLQNQQWNQGFNQGGGGGSGNLGGGGVTAPSPPANPQQQTSGGSLPNPLQQVLNSYTGAYQDYLNAVQGRYGDVARGFRDRFNRGWLGAEGLRDDVLTGYENRYHRGMDLIEGVGGMEAKDINRRYDELLRGNMQDLVSRGLTGTTIKPNVTLGHQREREDALSRLNERLLRQRLGTDAALSGDALNAQMSMGQNVIGTDAGLSGDLLNFMASRNDLPPDLGQLIGLAQAAGMGGVGQPQAPWYWQNGGAGMLPPQFQGGGGMPGGMMGGGFPGGMGGGPGGSAGSGSGSGGQRPSGGGQPSFWQDPMGWASGGTNRPGTSPVPGLAPGGSPDAFTEGQSLNDWFGNAIPGATGSQSSLPPINHGGSMDWDFKPWEMTQPVPGLAPGNAPPFLSGMTYGDWLNNQFTSAIPSMEVARAHLEQGRPAPPQQQGAIDWERHLTPVFQRQFGQPPAQGHHVAPRLPPDPQTAVVPWFANYPPGLFPDIEPETQFLLPPGLPGFY